MRIVDMLRQDLRYAIRGLRSRPGFAATVVLTMALGIGANATMFGILDRLLLRGPDQIRDPESVVVIETHRAGTPYLNSTFSYAAYTDFRDRAAGFSSVAAAWAGKDFPLGRGRDATRIAGSLVSASFFPTLGVRPAVGRFFQADEDDASNPQPVAVIGYGFWQRRFAGSRDALGQTLDIGAQRYRIVGVAPKGFTGIELNTVDVWLPITAANGLRFDSSPGWVTNRGATWLDIVARVKPGLSERLAAEQATAVHRAVLRQRMAEDPKLARFISPDSESVVLASLIPGKVPKESWGLLNRDDVRVAQLLGIVAVIVLLIACANVANLLLVRAFSRRREVAVRLALGITRSRLIAQLIIEGLLLTALGGGAALLIAHWTSRGVRTLLLGAGAWTTEAIDARMLGFTALLSVATGVMTSLAPALWASRSDVAYALKSGSREGGGQRSPLRTALLVIQAALAIVLLTGAGLFIRSVRNVNALPFGIDIDHVLVADVSHKAAGLTNAGAHQLYQQFASEVRRVPGVASSAVSIGLPFGLNWQIQVYVSGHTPPESDRQSAQYAVTPEYFSTLGIPLLAGRAFSSGDMIGSAPVAIVNDRLARLYWPGRSPVGECVKLGSDTMPCTIVVGVVGNTVKQELTDVVPQIYRPLEQLPATVTDKTISFFGYELVVRTTRDASRLAEPVRRTLQALGPSVPYANVRPMSELLGRRTRQWELGAKVFSAFGALALVLAVIGLYSVLAFTIAQRLHEFGVRMALGARGVDLVRLTVLQGLSPIAFGIAAGVGLTLLSGPLVASLLFDESPRDPAVLGGVVVLLLGTATLASLVPAFRATRVDPAAVLRSD